MEGRCRTMNESPYDGFSLMSDTRRCVNPYDSETQTGASESDDEPCEMAENTSGPGNVRLFPNGRRMGKLQRRTPGFILGKMADVRGVYISGIYPRSEFLRGELRGYTHSIQRCAIAMAPKGRTHSARTHRNAGKLTPVSYIDGKPRQH